MTLHVEGAISGKRFALEDTGGLVCLDCLAEFRDSQEFALHVGSCPGGDGARAPAPEAALEGSAEAGRRPSDPEGLPPGYEYAGGSGGYYRVTTPDGRTLAGPDNKKFHGRSDAADAAWADYLGGNA